MLAGSVTIIVSGSRRNTQLTARPTLADAPHIPKPPPPAPSNRKRNSYRRQLGFGFGLAILPRRLAAALRRRLGRDEEVGDVGHPRPAVTEEDLPDRDVVSRLVCAGGVSKVSS